MNFKPTKWKILISILIIILIYFIMPSADFIFNSIIGSKMCPTDNIIGKPFGIYGSAVCVYSDSSEPSVKFSIIGLIVDIIFFFIMFIISYVLFSLIEKKK